MTNLSVVCGVKRSDSLQVEQTMINIVPTIVALCRKTLSFSHSFFGWNTRYRVGRHTQTSKQKKKRNCLLQSQPDAYYLKFPLIYQITSFPS